MVLYKHFELKWHIWLFVQVGMSSKMSKYISLFSHAIKIGNFIIFPIFFVSHKNFSLFPTIQAKFHLMPFKITTLKLTHSIHKFCYICFGCSHTSLVLKIRAIIQIPPPLTFIYNWQKQKRNWIIQNHLKYWKIKKLWCMLNSKLIPNKILPEKKKIHSEIKLKLKYVKHEL